MQCASNCVNNKITLLYNTKRLNFLSTLFYLELVSAFVAMGSFLKTLNFFLFQMRPEKNWKDSYISFNQGLGPDSRRYRAPKSQLEISCMCYFHTYTRVLLKLTMQSTENYGRDRDRSLETSSILIEKTSCCWLHGASIPLLARSECCTDLSSEGCMVVITSLKSVSQLYKRKPEAVMKAESTFLAWYCVTSAW